MKEDLIRIIVNSLDLETSDIKEDTSIRSLTNDSLELTELLISIEDRFKIDIPDHEFNEIETIGDLIEHLERNSKYCGAV